MRRHFFDVIRMIIPYLRSLAGKDRTANANRQLAFVLSCVAGAINAGGLLVVGQFTSHMSGIVSAMADDLVAGSPSLLLIGLASVFFFIAGAASSIILINWAQKRELQAEYALPLIVEALLLLLFGVLGSNIAGVEWLFVPMAVVLLCFIMGLQNAMITKLSHGEIRTTHITGMITDIGIELGKALYWKRSPDPANMDMQADTAKLKNLSALVCFFFLGGAVGAFGFRSIGLGFTLLPAALLLLVALVPLLDDVRHLWCQHR